MSPQPHKGPRPRVHGPATATISQPRKELTRAIGELYQLETGVSTSDAKAAVANARSVLTEIQGTPLPSAKGERRARREARSMRITFNAAIDACSKIDLFLERQVFKERLLVSPSLVMQGNLSAIEDYLIGLP